MRRIDEVKVNEVYQFICDCHSSERRSPTLREIAAACDINSTGWVSSLLQVLEERSLIEFELRGNKRVISVPNNLSVGGSRNASIVGTCPCGEPVLAVENIVSTVALPIEIFGSEEHFILKATGNSMIKRGIFDGVTSTSAWTWIGHPVSGHKHATIRPIQTRSRFGSVP